MESCPKCKAEFENNSNVNGTLLFPYYCHKCDQSWNHKTPVKHLLMLSVVAPVVFLLMFAVLTMFATLNSLWLFLIPILTAKAVIMLMLWKLKSHQQDLVETSKYKRYILIVAIIAFIVFKEVSR